MNKYICSRCKVEFEIKHELDVEGGQSPVCNSCFNLIKNSRSAEMYYRNKKPIA